MSTRRSLSILALGLLACGQPSSPASSGEPTPSDKAPRVEPAPTELRPPTPTRAYVGVDGVGLHVIDEQGWRRLLDSRAPVRDLLEIDGALFGLSAFGIQRIDAAGQAETVAAIDQAIYSQLGEPVALAGVDGREFWVAGLLGVARYVEGGWQATPVDGRTPARPDLACDRAGRPWLALGELFQREQDRWRPLADIEPLALLADPRSEAMLVHVGCRSDTCVLLRISESVTRLELPITFSTPGTGLIDECSDHDRMAVSPDGTQAVLAGRCGLVRFNLDGEPKPRRVGLAEGWPGQPLRSVALDDGGRVWIGTQNGVTIVDAENRIEEYPLAKLGELAGPVGPILVLGHGPPPPPLGRVRIGGLTGTVVQRDGDDQRPLAKVRVDLCNRLPPGPEPAPDPTRSPCAGVDSVHTITTDADGRFELTEVPIDHYYFGVEIDGRWRRGQPKALNMRAGMSGNVGKVVVGPS